jgi:hypothetical protein
MVLKLFFTLEMTVTETNCYTEQCLKSKGMLFPFRSRLRELIPVMGNQLYITFALLMMMGIMQKPTSRSQFKKNATIAMPIFGAVTSLDRFESVCRFYISVIMKHSSQHIRVHKSCFQ